MEEFKHNQLKVYQLNNGNSKIYFDIVNNICLRKLDLTETEEADLGVKRFQYLNCVNKFGSQVGFKIDPPTTF